MELAVLPSNFNICRVDQRAAPVLQNLYEFYCHDMSQWIDVDTNTSGRFDHDLNECWTDDKATFIAYSGKLPIGFAIVQQTKKLSALSSDYDLKEFFVLRKFRQTGASGELAKKVWQRFLANWTVRVIKDNRPALKFWRKTITEYCRNAHKETSIQQNDKAWIYFSFTSSAQLDAD